MGEFSVTTTVDLFKGKETLMKEAATMALQAGVERFSYQLLSADWLEARWPQERTFGTAIAASIPR